VISHNQNYELLQDCLVRKSPAPAATDWPKAPACRRVVSRTAVTRHTPRSLRCRPNLRHFDVGVHFIPLFPKHSAFGWIDIEMKNQGGLPSTYTIPSIYTTEMPHHHSQNCQVLHQLERSGYHMRRVVPTVNLAGFLQFNSERKINVLNERRASRLLAPRLPKVRTSWPRGKTFSR
jgi:hypothetical protein